MPDEDSVDPQLSLSNEAFERLVIDGIDTIGSPFDQLIDNVVVVIEPRNLEESTILGLYEGVPLTERETYGSGFELPDRITIYRDALLEACSSIEELELEVKITVVHELAHHFGIDDDRLHELGWG